MQSSDSCEVQYLHLKSCVQHLHTKMPILQHMCHWNHGIACLYLHEGDSISSSVHGHGLFCVSLFFGFTMDMHRHVSFFVHVTRRTFPQTNCTNQTDTRNVNKHMPWPSSKRSLSVFLSRSCLCPSLSSSASLFLSLKVDPFQLCFLSFSEQTKKQRHALI